MSSGSYIGKTYMIKKGKCNVVIVTYLHAKKCFKRQTEKTRLSVMLSHKKFKAITWIMPKYLVTN